MSNAPLTSNSTTQKNPNSFANALRAGFNKTNKTQTNAKLTDNAKEKIEILRKIFGSFFKPESSKFFLNLFQNLIQIDAIDKHGNKNEKLTETEYHDIKISIIQQKLFEKASPLIDRFRDCFLPKFTGKILEIGPGLGLLATYIQNAELSITVIEPNPIFAEVCKKKGLTVIEKPFNTDFTKSLSEADKFDTIVLHNFPLGVTPEDLNPFIQAFKSCLNPGGKVLYFRDQGIQCTDISIHTPKALKIYINFVADSFEKHGFSVQAQEFKDQFNKPGPQISYSSIKLNQAKQAYEAVIMIATLP